MLEIGIIQMQSEPLEVEKNLRFAENLIDRAVSDGARLGVPTVLVNQGGRTFTPCQTPRFYPFPPLKQMKYEFCGKSSIRDSSGNVIIEAEGNKEDYFGVVSVEVQSKSNYREIDKTEIENCYMSSDYYIVQPPLTAKIFQSYFYSGLQDIYEARRKKYQS